MWLSQGIEVSLPLGIYLREEQACIHAKPCSQMLVASLLIVVYFGPRSTIFQRINEYSPGLYLAVKNYEAKSKAGLTRVELGETVLSEKVYPEDCMLCDFMYMIVYDYT